MLRLTLATLQKHSNQEEIGGVGVVGPVLRIVPSFVFAHTFCVSPDGLSNSGFLRMVPTKTKVFLCSL